MEFQKIIAILLFVFAFVLLLDIGHFMQVNDWLTASQIFKTRWISYALFVVCMFAGWEILP